MHIQSDVSEDNANLDNDSRETIVVRLEKAVEHLITERNQYRKEVSSLNEVVVGLKNQLAEKGDSDQMENELNKARRLQDNLEKRLLVLVERLKGLVEEEDL